MQKIVFTFVFFFCVAVYGQEVQGIGEIQIGMSEAQFLELPDIKSNEIKDAAEKDSSRRNSNYGTVWRTTNNSNFKNNSNAIYTKGYIKYNFILNIGLVNLKYRMQDYFEATAKFYKDELIEVSLNDFYASDFDETLAKKYGKPTIRDNQKKIVCQNGYGVTSVHFDGEETSIWSGKGQVRAKFIREVSLCGSYSVQNYIVSDVKKAAILNELESKAKLNAIKTEQNSKAVSSKL